MNKKKDFLSAWTFGEGLRLMTFKNEKKEITGLIEGPDGTKIEIPKDKAEMAAKGYVSAKNNEELKKFLNEMEEKFDTLQLRKKTE